jgi:hypothetical protein
MVQMLMLVRGSVEAHQNIECCYFYKISKLRIEIYGLTIKAEVKRYGIRPHAQFGPHILLSFSSVLSD